MGVKPNSQARAFVAIGSNLDHPSRQVILAMDVLDQTDQCSVIRRSSLYVTEPVGFDDQPKFVNAVCLVSTVFDPLNLLKHLLEVEKQFGRIRDELPNRPRIIDLDLLIYGNEQIDSLELSLPHPRMHERRFVLQPLIEISPDVRIPGQGLAADWLLKCTNQIVQPIESE